MHQLAAMAGRRKDVPPKTKKKVPIYQQYSDRESFISPSEAYSQTRPRTLRTNGPADVDAFPTVLEHPNVA